MSDSTITQITLLGMTATLLASSLRGGLRSLVGVHRRQRGRCGQCGYDLRGLAEARCPECGREFTYPIVTTSDSLHVEWVEPVHSAPPGNGPTPTPRARNPRAGDEPDQTAPGVVPLLPGG